MKKLPALREKSFDISATVVLKTISDWAAILKKLSPVAGVLFIILNLPTLIRKWKAIVTILLLVPLLIMNPRAEVLRVIFSVCIFWIFLQKFASGIGKMNYYIALALAVYSIAMFAGILNPDFYTRMDDGTYRYRFILETHNALSILVFTIFIYQVEALLAIMPTPGRKWVKAILILGLCCLTLVFLFIKSRLYIGMSLSYILIVAFLRVRKFPILAIIPAVYLVTFFALIRFTIREQDKQPVEVVRHDTVYSSAPAGMSTSSKQVLDKMINNERLMESNATGRGKLTRAFSYTFHTLGWQKFLYSCNVDQYMYVKERIPNINVKASSLTECSYLTIILAGSLVGLAIFVYLYGTYIWYFLSHREFLSLAYFALLLGVWTFEETVMFTFSMVGHLFALASINRLEKERHESSPGH